MVVSSNEVGFRHLRAACQDQQDAISQKKIVFRFRKDIQSEKGLEFGYLVRDEKSRGGGNLC